MTDKTMAVTTTAAADATPTEVLLNFERAVMETMTPLATPANSHVLNSLRQQLFKIFTERDELQRKLDDEKRNALAHEITGREMAELGKEWRQLAEEASSALAALRKDVEGAKGLPPEPPEMFAGISDIHYCVIALRRYSINLRTAATRLVAKNARDAERWRFIREPAIDSFANTLAGDCPVCKRPYAPAHADGVVVPREPTEEMIVAMMEQSVLARPSIDDDTYVRSIYKAMLSAGGEG